MPSPFDLLVWIYFALLAVLAWALAPLLTAAGGLDERAQLAVPAVLALLAIAQVHLLATRVQSPERRRLPQLPLWLPATVAVLAAALLLGLAAVLGVHVAAAPSMAVTAAALLLATTWTTFGLLFRRAARTSLRGRLLDLLVAAPVHAALRRRGCRCADGNTAFGLAVGLPVALLAFGPAFGALLARRLRHHRERVLGRAGRPGHLSAPASRASRPRPAA
jgi:hypothetical protein